MEDNMNLKGTKSEENLKAALAGESIARNKYTYFAKIAEEEGHADVAELYERMAENESEHAKIWYKFLNGDFKDTMANIYDSAISEGYEYTSMYPDFAKTAREEGLDDLAEMFEKIAKIEHNHELTFLKAMSSLVNKSDDFEPEVEEEERYNYRCAFCGDTSADYKTVCPVCGAIGAYQEI